MKWIVTSKSGKQEFYELWSDDEKLLSLEFHPSTNSARISSADEQRVFLIRKEGFLKNKTVLRNEYGIRIGQLEYERSHPNEGAIVLDNEKFFYSIENNPLAELKIYKDSKEEPLVVCGLKPKNGNTLIKFGNKGKTGNAEHILLMSLCWYLFLPIAKENTVEYAL